MNPEIVDLVIGLAKDPAPKEPLKLITLKTRDAPRADPNAGWDEDPLDMAEPTPEPPRRVFKLSWGDFFR